MKKLILVVAIMSLSGCVAHVGSIPAQHQQKKVGTRGDNDRHHQENRKESSERRDGKKASRLPDGNWGAEVTYPIDIKEMAKQEHTVY